MRVLVTGAFGFIGTAVVRRLTLAGHDVVALTHRPSGMPMPTSRACDVFHADICDASAIRAAVSDVDAVCHLAALSLVRESFERPAEYQQVNAVGTRTIVDALASKAAESGEPALYVHASTHAVYGAPGRQPIVEITPLAPMSPYGQSKADAEAAVAAASSTGALRAVCLRLFNVAGAVEDRTDTEQSRIIPRTLAVAAGRADILEINGDGGAIQDGDEGCRTLKRRKVARDERPNDQRVGETCEIAKKEAAVPPPPLDLDDGGAGDVAVKVAAAPFPSLRSVTAPAVRREALPKSSEEGGWRWPRARTRPRLGAQNPGGSRGRPCSRPVSATASSHGEAVMLSRNRHALATIPSASTASPSGEPGARR